MKNLFIYTGPDQKFTEGDLILAKIQIENCLDLGWKKEDILLYTDFPYEYQGIKSHVLPAGIYCDFSLPSSKTVVLDYLLNHSLIEPDNLYWCHDFDVFQNVAISPRELESELGTGDVGLCDRGRMPQWNTGSIFFKSSSKDIFGWLKNMVYKQKLDEEDAFWVLCGRDLPSDKINSRFVKGYTKEDILGIENINDRIKRINITYNLRPWNIRSSYKEALKPIRAIHLDPFNPDLPGREELDFFMYGKNKINTVLMTERLMNIFHKYDIK